MSEAAQSPSDLVWPATRRQATRRPTLTRAAPDPPGSVVAVLFYMVKTYFYFQKTILSLENHNKFILTPKSLFQKFGKILNSVLG
jgi:hypothetical protein